MATLLGWGYKQRPDGGYDFYNGNQKTNIDNYVQATGDNRQQLVQKLAQTGDRVAQAALLRPDRGAGPVLARPTKVPQIAQPTLNSPLTTQQKVSNVLNQTTSPVPGITPQTWAKMTPEVQQKLIKNEIATKQSAANIFNPSEMGKDVWNGVAQPVVDSTANTVNLIGDLGAGALANLSGNDELKKAAGAQIADRFGKSIPGAIYKSLDTIGNVSGALIYDALHPDSTLTPVQREQKYQAMDDQTAHAGITTDISKEDAARKIGGAYAETGLNIITAGQPVYGKLAETLGVRSGEVVSQKLINEATKRLAAQSGETALQQAAKNGIVNGGIPGALSGAAGTLQQDNATAQDYLTNSLTGLASGSVVGTAMPYVSSKVETGLRNISDNAKMMASMSPTERQRYIERGYVKVPGNAPDDIVKKVFQNGTDEYTLYHGTTFQNAINILNDGKIRANTPNGNRALKHVPNNAQVSLSRQKNSGFYNSKSADIKFVVDSNKIGKTNGYVDGDLKPSDYKNPSFFEAESQVKRDIPMSSIKRIEGGPLLNPKDEAAIRKIADKHGITFVGFDDAKTMRSILPKRNDAQSRVNQAHAESDQQELPLDGTTRLNTANGRMSLAQGRETSGRQEQIAPQMTKSLQEQMLVPPSQQKVSQGNLGRTAEPSSPTYTTTNSLTAKAKRQSLSDDVVEQLNATHEIRNTRELANTVDKIAAGMSDKTLIDTAHSRLAAKLGSIDDADIALVHKAIERADAKNAVREAVDLHDALSAHLTAKGQAIQAATLLYDMTPQGRFYKATRDLSKAGVEMSEKLVNELKAQTEAIKRAAPEDKPLLTAKFIKTVQDNMPKKVTDNALSVWKAGLLSGPLTHAGNMLSNSTFGALSDVSNPLAVGIDRGLSALGKTSVGKRIGLSGDRTRTLTLRGRTSGTLEGIQKAGNTLRTGIDERNIQGNKYDIHGEINFKNPVVQKILGDPSNGIFRLMSAGDQPFYYSQLKNSLYDLAKADGINKGLKGKALSTYADNLVKNPSESMLNTATQEAQRAVLSQDNKLASGVNRLLNSSGIGKAGQTIVPFVKVPMNFLSRTIDFTPAGIGKAIVNARKSYVKNGVIDQRAFSKAISEAATGTAIIGLGSTLASAGLLSGDYPSSDQKEQQRWKAEGITPNSVKIGDTWYSLNYLGPVGMLLGAGKDYHDAGEGSDGAIAATMGVGQNLTNQSFLTGFSGFANALNDPGRYGEKLIAQQGGSAVPFSGAFNAVANATDSKQRDTDASSPIQTAVNTAVSKIPGARTTLPSKQDVYGNELNQRTDPVNLTLNPTKPSNAITNDVKSEVSRLHNADPNNKDLQVTPTTIDDYLTIDGKKVQLTDSQTRDLQTKVGQATQDAWNNLIKSNDYKLLADTEKANALDGIRKDISAVVKSKFAQDNALGNIKLSTRQQSVSSGLINNANYTQTEKSSGGVNLASGLDKQSTDTLTKYNSMTTSDRSKWFSTQNDAEYQYALAKYNNDKKAGSVSDIQDITKQKELAKSKIGSVYPQSVRDLYGLSKTDIYNYVSNNKDGKKLADQLIAYDKSLYDAGLSSSLKFKTGIASSTGSKKSGSKKSSSVSVSSLISASKVAQGTKVPTIKAYSGSKMPVSTSKLAATALKKYQVKKVA